MGQYFEYFAATVDTARGCAADGPTAAGLDVAELKWVDPVVMVSELCAVVHGEELGCSGSATGQWLGRFPTTLLSVPGDSELIAVHGDTTASLASVGDDRIGSLATAWAASEYWVSAEDPEELVHAVRRLRDTAVAASRPDHGLYAWWPE
ncbi:hypothetical protein [Streptomyces spiramenti]|uniref:Uncharacterized protein n=1 Tax=Streptomyces spiramenti TaxID=2720606 RepID=A0ABX1ASM1_9ACTN|nr:hypothetical protein [Streptomyces spiramenti]NJP69151.1 hypothetical protein [Streptomyces spiramenti]